MKKINFQDNITKANAETMNTFQDNIENAIDNLQISIEKKEIQTYNLTINPDKIPANSWQPLAANHITDTLKGKYLIIYSAIVSSTENGYLTLNAALDGEMLSNYNRTSIPLGGGLTMTGSIVTLQEFTEQNIHTINLYSYANQEVSVSGVKVMIIKLGE